MNPYDGLYHKTYTCPVCGTVIEISSTDKKTAQEKLYEAFSEHHKKCREKTSPHPGLPPNTA